REGPEARRRNAVARHQILREGLRAFEARRRPAWAEHAEASLAKAVGKPGRQRHLRPDDGQVDPFARCKRHQLLGGAVLHVDTLAVTPAPRIPRRGNETGEPRTPG